jgi:ATP-binding cassette subfamily B protein
MLPLSRWRGDKRIRIADPARGILALSREEFLKGWISTTSDDGEPAGTLLLLDPTPKFYEEAGEKEHKLSWQLVFQYLNHSRWQITQVFLTLLITSALQLVLPFLTQSIVDTGINTQNMQFITVILIAQLMLVFSRTAVEFIRSRLLLHVSTIVNISILSDFWIKLMRLPISYFDSHHTGDTLQRINDHQQIRSFLTGTALGTLFSLLNFFIFAFVLAAYNILLFLVFLGGAILYFGWVQIFLRVRRKINYQTFNLSAKENTATLQLVQGMQEIRLHNAEQLKRWEWESIQSSIFRLNFRSLTYSQVQQAGALLINQGKDLFISYLVASFVIEGKLTLGAMLAIQYIIGQLSSPIEQFVGFVQSAQDARISMERLNEIHQLKDEEERDSNYIRELPSKRDIYFNNLVFTYPGAGNEPVLKNINLVIPEGKTTAIVGVSGSGKTTLLKLLLKFYDHYSGDIKIGDTNFRYISPSFWRQQCGSVLQDGFIFNDTIARNIAVGEEAPEYATLLRCAQAANILSFIESLPNGFNTMLGAEGVGVSQGQKQRLMIARAIYKDPQIILFDEATNALDANNERVIVEGFREILKEKTVIVVAHRLSTVKNADKIVVLQDGEIVEEGTHHYLSAIKGKYYELVENQLELGN